EGEADNVIHGAAHRLRQKILDSVDVVVEPRLDLTTLRPREEGERHPLQVVVERPPKGQDNARADSQARDQAARTGRALLTMKSSPSATASSATCGPLRAGSASSTMRRITKAGSTWSHPAGCREEQVPQQPASIRLGEAPGAAKHGGVQREAAKAVG